MARMTLSTTGSSSARTSATKTAKPRRSPLEAAIVAAERQLTRMTRRKARAGNRIVRIQARLDKARASIGQYDAVLKQLQANIDSLKAAS